MHIPDGILSAPVCLAGYAVTSASVWYSLKKIKKQENYKGEIPKVSLVTAVFFVASLISVPIPPASVHLVLTGTLGILLGIYAMPAILVTLFLQAVMFHHGGLTTLGVNAVILGIPAVVCSILYRVLYNISGNKVVNKIISFMTGFLGVCLSILLFSLIIILFLPEGVDATAERNAVIALVIAHIPLMLIEGVFTVFLVEFLEKTKPEILGER
ncbi:cobalt transporter CbiM [Abyssisolibacter fermentans]|uniref:cobalt transporter CbiM n=1 Tax=Abyssisolibacter fermentans TaxID=1766203 RepID=UPI000836C73E|nr:cobalt transporter CbiM [Abyssisolibacter fermentans]